MRSAKIRVGIRRDEDRIPEAPRPDDLTAVILGRLRDHDLLRTDRQQAGPPNIVIDSSVALLLRAENITLRAPFDLTAAKRKAEQEVRRLYPRYWDAVSDELVLAHIIHSQTNIPEVLWAIEQHLRGKTAVYFHAACYLYCRALRTYGLAHIVDDQVIGWIEARIGQQFRLAQSLDDRQWGR